VIRLTGEEKTNWIFQVFPSFLRRDRLGIVVLNPFHQLLAIKRGKDPSWKNPDF